MRDLRSIVVGIDFSAPSRVALAQALRLASAAKATVHPIHVIETLVAVHMTDELSAFQTQVTASLVDDAKQAWKDFAQSVPGAAQLPLHVEINSPAAGISAFCKHKRADLLVLGTHGTSGGRRGVGGLAGAAARRAPCDVLLVRETQTGPFKTILACVDFSATSKEAVGDALSIAALDSAAVHILYAFTPAWETMKPRPGSPETTPQFREQYADVLRQQLQAFCDPARPEVLWARPTFHARPHHNHGKAIAQTAAELHADLIALGARGSTNLHDLVLGSTAERVFSEAGTSLLVVRPK